MENCGENPKGRGMFNLALMTREITKTTLE